MPLRRLVGLTLVLLLASSLARAEEAALDRPFAIAGYGTGWSGAYGAGGVGGRLRWEPWRNFGLDLFGEALAVESPHGFRHDHPIGFNVFVPVRLGGGFRLRPMLGMCAVMSFIEPEEKDAPASDDVLLGAHVGLGVERSLGTRLSAFVDVQGVLWAGHDRTLQGWTGAVSNDLHWFPVVQAVAGVSFHLGER